MLTVICFSVILIYQQGDLFESSDVRSSLAHCVSSDFKMSQGIARKFSQKFEVINELRETNGQVGNIVVVREGGRFIYNLVTKEKFSDSPTYDNLRLTIDKMKDHALKNFVKEISMPKIGCGLDQLKWNVVASIIKSAFLGTDIKITVFQLGKNLPCLCHLLVKNK